MFFKCKFVWMGHRKNGGTIFGGMLSMNRKSY
jgi:hypothetical protein